MHTENTLALTPDWDLSFDASGNLKTLAQVEAICQNVCNETRLWYRDAYFRYDEGIDWFTDQLGQPLQESVVTERLRNVALSVPGVISIVNIELTEIDQETRTLHGKIEIETQYGYGTSYL
jgi:hypothetical protein